MPSRKNIVEVETPEVQGADSWIKIRRPTVEEVMGHQRRETNENAPLDERYEASIVSAMTYVVAWNWVDDKGHALPQPQDDDHVHRLLTDSEVDCILEAIFGNKEKRKN